MNRQHEHVLFGTEPQQRRPKQPASRQVERLEQLLRREPLRLGFPLGRRPRAQIRKRQRERPAGRRLLDRLTVLDHDASPESLVAPHDFL
jgi:hypothetical protein